MKYIKIEQYINTYDLETQIYMSDEKELERYLNDESFQHNSEGIILDKNSHKFYKEIRENLDCEYEFDRKDMEGLFETIWFKLVYFIPFNNDEIIVEDCAINLGTKFTLLNKK